MSQIYNGKILMCYEKIRTKTKKKKKGHDGCMVE